MAKSGFIGAMDKLPWIVKLILCIPLLNIVWAIYRIVKGLSKNKLIMVVVGVLWIIPGAVFLWIVDLVCTILFGKPKVFA
jgi:hypothetical protein